jgi:hypothetical protein
LYERCYIAGLCIGNNFPKEKYWGKPFIDLEDCKDVILVDRTYFLENFGHIISWAIDADEKPDKWYKKFKSNKKGN